MEFKDTLHIASGLDDGIILLLFDGVAKHIKCQQALTITNQLPCCCVTLSDALLFLLMGWQYFANK